MTTLHAQVVKQQTQASQPVSSVQTSIVSNQQLVKLSPYRLIRLREVKELTGLSGSTIYDRMDAKSKYYDDTFPKQVHLTTNTARWVLSEIEAWIISKIEQRTTPPKQHHHH